MTRPMPHADRCAAPQGRPPARSGHAAKRSASSEDAATEVVAKNKRSRLLKLCAEPFQELPRETLIDEAIQAAWLLLTLTCLGQLWRFLP